MVCSGSLINTTKTSSVLFRRVGSLSLKPFRLLLIYSFHFATIMTDPTELSMLFSSSEEEEQFIADGNLEMLLDNYTPSQLSQHDGSKDSKIIKNSRPIDILIGRYVSHPGNVLARKVIQTNRDFFRTLDSDQRKEAVDATIAFFESKGSRFLEAIGKNNCSFRIATYFNVAEKFRKSLRETGIRADRPPPGKSKKAKRLGKVSAVSTKVAPVKVQKKVKVKSQRNLPPPAPVAKSRASVPVVFNPRQVKAGDRLGIFWPEDAVYYPGTVTRISGTQVRFRYDDGERETIDIARENFVILGKSPRDREVDNDYKENKIQTSSVTSSNVNRVTRRVSLPEKESPGSSVNTQSSTDSNTCSSDRPKEPVPIHVHGAFNQAQAVPVPSLAAFLLQKLKRTSA